MRQRGFTLVELLMVIVVLGIAAGTLSVVSTRSAQWSAEMLRQQQAMSLGNAILDEVRAMPFTYCDPNDANALTATSQAGCTSPVMQERLLPAAGPQPGEVRLGATPVTRFDNVGDYNGWSAPANTLLDASGNVLTAALPTVAACTVAVAVVAQAFAGVPATDAARMTVTVACPGQIAPYVVDGVRVRYAPNRSTF